MMAKSLALGSALAVALFGCVSEPEFLVNVPDGWQSMRPYDRAGQHARYFEKGAANVSVQAGRRTMFPSKTSLVTDVIRTVVMVGGEVGAITNAPDGSSTRLAFAYEDGDRGRVSGRLAIWLTSDRQRLIVVTGTWPAEQDKALAPIFDSVAASARFR